MEKFISNVKIALKRFKKIYISDEISTKRVATLKEVLKGLKLIGVICNCNTSIKLKKFKKPYS